MLWVAGCGEARVRLETWTELQERVPRNQWKRVAVPAERVSDGKPIYIRASEAMPQGSDDDPVGTQKVQVRSRMLIGGVAMAFLATPLIVTGAWTARQPDPPRSPGCFLFCTGGNEIGGTFLIVFGSIVLVPALTLIIVDSLRAKTRPRPPGVDPSRLVPW
jgi:hypothetical protein